MHPTHYEGAVTHQGPELNALNSMRDTWYKDELTSDTVVVSLVREYERLGEWECLGEWASGGVIQ